MTDHLTGFSIQEIPLQQLSHGSQARRELLRVHRSWVDAGLVRWFSFFDPEGPWPLFLLAAKRQSLYEGAHPDEGQTRGGALESQGAPERLLIGAGREETSWMATIVGLWAPAPIERFDDLFEECAPGEQRGEDRPQGGVWHLIAATVAPEARGMDLGRQMVGAAIDWVRQRSAEARVCTLSPAAGLPGWCDRVRGFLERFPGEAAQLPTRDFASLLPFVMHTLCRRDGTPVLPILRLHLKAGAVLDKVLLESRVDERRSGRVNLRFAYATEDEAREQQQRVYQRWCRARAAAIREGHVIRLEEEGDIWWVTGFQEPLIWRELASTSPSLSLELPANWSGSAC